jgi:hypothetical protein
MFYEVPSSLMYKTWGYLLRLKITYICTFSLKNTLPSLRWCFDIKLVIYAKFWVKMTSIIKFYQELKKKTSILLILNVFIFSHFFDFSISSENIFFFKLLIKFNDWCHFNSKFCVDYEFNIKILISYFSSVQEVIFVSWRFLVFFDVLWCQLVTFVKDKKCVA